MPVTTPHPEYEANVDSWKKMRDVIAGEETVKKEGVVYLPQPSGRSDDDFKKYVQRAQFFDATSKTAAGMVGGIFRKPPLIEVPPECEYLLDDADGKGTPLDQLSKDAAEEVTGLGRVGLLVDMPNVPEVKRLDEERDMGAEARIYVYAAESVINWTYARIGSIYKLARVVLEECITVAADGDEFAQEEQTIYRVLDLEAESEDQPAGYRVRVFEKSGEVYAETGAFRPTMPNGERLDFIPFTFVGSANNTAGVDKPPLLDIANVNIGHYRNSADYEDALFMVGQPTPVITGLDQQFIEKNKGQFVIGSRAAWMLPTGSTADLMESSRDLGALSTAMDAKEAQMIQLGAKLIDARRSGIEAAETVRLRQAGEASVLGSISDNISRAFGLLLDWTAMWMGAAEDGTAFTANADFFPARLTSADLKELVASWQGGVITYGTLFENLVAGEIITPGTDLEDYEDDLETEALKNPAPDLGDEPLDENDEEEEEEEEDNDDE